MRSAFSAAVSWSLLLLSCCAPTAPKSAKRGGSRPSCASTAPGAASFGAAWPATGLPGSHDAHLLGVCMPQPGSVNSGGEWQLAQVALPSKTAFGFDPYQAKSQQFSETPIG
jgi:hypothetical protein